MYSVLDFWSMSRLVVAIALAVLMVIGLGSLMIDRGLQRSDRDIAQTGAYNQANRD